MSISVVLAALFGKAAVGAATKGIAAKAIAGKASVAGAKAMASHHGHGSLAHKIASELANEAKNKNVDAAAERAEDTLSMRGQKHGDA